MKIRVGISSLNVAVLAALVTSPIWAAEPEYRGLVSTGVGPYAGTLTCQTISREVYEQHLPPAEAGWRPLPRPGESLKPMASGHPAPMAGGNNPSNWWSAGMYPEGYEDPLQHVRETGHLVLEEHIELAAEGPGTRLENVASVDVASWGRQMLVEFIPDTDRPAHQRGAPGLYLRPNRPFVPLETDQNQDDLWGVDLSIGNVGVPTDMQRHGRAQATYRSDGAVPDILLDNGETGFRPTLLLTPHMDPAPAGRSWNIALAQVRNTNPVRGTLRVWLANTNHDPKLTMQILFSENEQQNQTGLFDPTPWTSDGDNPATTLGEARRWVVWRAVEGFLEDLDAHAPFPAVVRVLGYEDPDSSLYGSSIGGMVAAVDPATGSGRMAGRHSVPIPVFEREAGTSLCQGTSHNGASGRGCIAPEDQTLGNPGRGRGYINLNFGRELDLNVDSSPGESRVALYNVVLHELSHALGFDSMYELDYRYTESPPRRFAEAANSSWTPEPVAWGMRHFVGPYTATSPRNEFAGTDEPGSRLWGDTQSIRAGHLDPSLTTREVMSSGLSWDPAFPNLGVAGPIFWDLGYQRDALFATHERRLPRLYYDPTRSGHGIDFRRVTQADGREVFVMKFYTFNADGDPEWYLGTGEIDAEAIFETVELGYFTYDANRSPRQQIDPGRSGSARLDLDPPIDHPVCASRREAGQDLVAVFEWELGGESESWCVEPLKFGDQPAFPIDGTGSWYAGSADSGWGLSLASRNYGQFPILSAIAYYFDGNGEPTWAIGSTGASRTLPFNALRDGLTVPMLHMEGFCRSCAPSSTQSTPNGSLRLRFNDPAAGQGNWIEQLELENHGPGGGTWQRSDMPIELLSDPHPRMLH